MTTATLELYHALVDAGVSEEKAERTAKAVISRDEANNLLASKAELYKVKNELIMWIVGSQVALAGLIISVLG